MRGFSLTMSFAPRRLFRPRWPHTLTDAKEAVMLIVQTSLSASSDFEPFQINCYINKKSFCVSAKSTSGDLRLSQGRARVRIKCTDKEYDSFIAQKQAVSSDKNSKFSRPHHQKKSSSPRFSAVDI